MRVRLGIVLVGTATALGGCALPPPYATRYHRPAYRSGPAASRPAMAAGPQRPLPVPPQPPVRATAAACTRAAPASLSEARQQQLFRQFAELEKSKQDAGTASAAVPSAAGAPAALPACDSAP